MPRRRWIPGPLALALVACARAPEPPSASAAPADVLLVTLDTVRADALGCYGAGPERTPALDALAAAGVVFERCASVSGITPVAHASILTGLEPPRHGLRVFSGPSGYRLDAEVPTLAETLAARGWTTAAVHSAIVVSSRFGLTRGFATVDELDGEFVRDMASGSPDAGARFRAEFQRRSDETVDRALALLRDAPRPLFLWVHLFDVHNALQLPPAELLRVDPERASQDALYVEELRYQDAQLGRLLAAFRARAPEGWIAVVGDHGEGLADGVRRHGWSHHEIVYEEQLRVPLVLAGPGLPPGRRVEALVSVVDLAPTLLEALGLPPDGALDGASLLGAARGAAPAPARVVYAEQLAGYTVPPPGLLQSRPQDDFVYVARDAQWKLLYRPAHPAQSELFDLAADPGEQQDRLRERPDVARRLLRALADRAPWLDRPYDDDPQDPDPEFTAALIALGYTGRRRDGGALVGPQWEWVCVEDGARDAVPGPCPRCGAPRAIVRAWALALPGLPEERR